MLGPAIAKREVGGEWTSIVVYNNVAVIEEVAIVRGIVVLEKKRHVVFSAAGV